MASLADVFADTTGAIVNEFGKVLIGEGYRNKIK